MAKSSSKRGAAKRPYRYPAHLRTSAPRNNRCYKCGKAILSATYDALPIHLDPQALTAIGELDATLQQIPTWFIANGNLFKRTAWAVQTSPKGIGGVIVQEHRCDRPQPYGLCAIPPKKIETDEPGF